MWRTIHAWLGLGAAVLLLVLAVSGAVLATKPLYQAYAHGDMRSGLSVAQVIHRIAEANPRITPQQLQIAPSGAAMLRYTRNNRQRENAVSLESGKFLHGQKTPKQYAFFQNLHRSFLLGEKGRLLPAFGGIIMLILCVSGMFLLLRRLGGWRRIFAPVGRYDAGGLHSLCGRLLLPVLLLSALTALWLSAVTFHLLPSGEDKAPAYPETLEKKAAVAPWTLHGLQEIEMAAVVEIIYPIPDDWFDVWTVRTADGYVFIDRFSGDVLSRQALPPMARIMAWVRLLHTGEGAPWWALVLLCAALSIPFFALSGVIVWARRRGSGRIRNNAGAAAATVLIAVGSEGGSTWGFAKALHGALHDAGMKVRTIEMNALQRHYPALRYLLVLTATYGDGDAPKSATRFVAHLAKNDNRDIACAVLAFGDKSFPAYCAFGDSVAAALAAQGMKMLLPIERVDRQSAQTFARWCMALGKALALPLTVAYTPPRVKTHTLTLASRHNYGAALGFDTAVLRFDGDKLPRFVPGDLVAVYPPQSASPRLYSVASDSVGDGFLALCVRHQEGGLCSPWLCRLPLGSAIEITVRENPHFRLPRRRSVVMIAAGTGIAPFVGMIRHNRSRQTLALYWGGRHPDVDDLYGREISAALADGRLSHYQAAWSRLDGGGYVQDVLRTDHARLHALLTDGAVVMVCGGQAMAAAVRAEIDALLRTVGSSLEALRQQQRYLEDIY